VGMVGQGHDGADSRVAVYNPVGLGRLVWDEFRYVFFFHVLCSFGFFSSRPIHGHVMISVNRHCDIIVACRFNAFVLGSAAFILFRLLFSRFSLSPSFSFVAFFFRSSG